MPRRTDLKRVLIIGSGPIVIGQACEFDYSGSQACKALRAEGLEVILVNSNPATIMTDPELADRTYVEPLTPEVLAAIIERERPDALLPTVGGQTALNLAVDLANAGMLEKFNVKLIGASIEAIKVAEDRQLFKDAMREIGLDVPQSGLARTLRRGGRAGAARSASRWSSGRRSRSAASAAASPTTSKSSASSPERGLELSPVHEVLIEESVIGWKEFELEVMRDVADNFVVICSIENIDPMGVHTGDSITVAPILTLSDKEYQRMRDAARRIIRQGRRRDRRIEHPVRGQPGERPDGRHRDEPARLAVVGAGVEGDRVPDREDRRQAGARLSPRRDPERHHAPDAGLLRADHRLRRRQDSALELREVPAGRSHADDADEVGGRGDGDRPDVQGSVHEGRAVARARAQRPAVRAVDATCGRRRDDAALRKRLAIPTDRRMWDLFRAHRSRLDGRAAPRADARSIRGSCGSSPKSPRCAQRRPTGGLDGLDAGAMRRLKRAGFGDQELALAVDDDREPRSASAARARA